VARRRLIGAGLGLLAALGLDRLALLLGDGPGARLARGERRRLEATEEWKRLLAIWKEAEEIVANKRGPYPFDQAGQDRVLAALGRAQRELDALVKAGLLAAPAAGILKKDLALLAHGVNRFRPTERKNATCYRPMALPDETALSLGRLRERLPLLERLAASSQLQPAAVEKALLGIERDLARVGDGKLRPADSRLRASLAAKVASLRARLRAAK
jgi:hypothetical protein